MNDGDWPKVSFIMPTLNAGSILENCLASIARQTYPRERYEILLADAFSKDDTRAIAARYHATVLDDRGNNMEEGKRLALSHATGEFVVFVDADNEITHSDYIELAVRGLAARPRALGVESYYLPSPKMTSFCAYLTHLLHISDPVSWIMSANPVLVAREGEVERWTLPGNSLAYPLGANGFVFRKSDLDAVHSSHSLFQDTHVPLYLMQQGKREWLRIRGRGVHHYYIQTLGAFLRKRRRAMAHFFNVQEQSKTSWAAGGRSPVPPWLAALYVVSGVGPLYHTVRGFWRDRDWRWIWHFPTCWASLLGIFWGWQTARTHRDNKKLIADLQVPQTLKNSGASDTSAREKNTSTDHDPRPSA